MSDPVDGENEEATEPASPETGVGSDSAAEPGPASAPEAAVSSEEAVSDAIHQAAVAAEAEALTEANVADVVIPDAEIPALDVPEPVIPEPVLPASVFDEPVIPPAPASDSDDDATVVPATRASRRALPKVDDLPDREPIPRDPSVVPPASGATSGNYRIWTGVIFALLFILLIAAFATIIVLLTGGVSPFPSADAPAAGWIPLVG